MVFCDHISITPIEKLPRFWIFAAYGQTAARRLSRANIRPILSTSRAKSQRFWRAIKYPIETKLLYLRLRGLAAAGEISPSDESGTDNAISELLRLLDNSAQHQLVGGLQSRLNRSEAEFANLRTEMWRDIKANHRWGYRFYRKVLWPFQLSCYRSSQ